MFPFFSQCLRRDSRTLRSYNEERHPGSMEHPFCNTAQCPMLHSASPMGRHGDKIDLALLRRLHNGFCYVRIGHNGSSDRKVILRQRAFRKACGHGLQILLVLVFSPRSHFGFVVGIHLTSESAVA